ncbi:MAG: RsmB/NOP family class I SAM-dependent RNA methyltransferase [Methylobacteriaceae bacterium]|nr:RsmB/NOP family class I SAM-dependent RNA methyltransferase [Methylobacteriaceae bacterium]
MTPSARLSAAIEVLADIEARRRPAADALKDWGLAHRFAGSKDRAAVASLVYDGLRRKSSSTWIMGADTPRAAVLGALRELRGVGAESIAALCSGEGHAPAPLSDDEQARLTHVRLDDAPAHVRGDYPEWLAPSFAAAFADDAAEEGRALAQRAPLDVRVNALKADRAKAMKALAHLHPEPTLLSPIGLRLPLAEDGRGPSLQGEPAYVKGLVEVQDEGSQLAALLSGVHAGQQVLDLCAGGGGKALAFAAMMENKGQVYATDSDGRRLTPIYPRLERAGARNVQVRAPRGADDRLADLHARCDVVVVDAPCTGTGTWRRNPDAKWRMRPGALAQRLREQDEILEKAVEFLKPNGRLVYITCSVLREENEDRVAGFLGRHSGFEPIDPTRLAEAAGLPEIARFASPHGPALRLTPRAAGTDGFFVAALKSPA